MAAAGRRPLAGARELEPTPAGSGDPSTGRGHAKLGRLGAGRARQGDPVQAAAGVTWEAGIGDRVRRGDPLFTLHTDTPERIQRAREALVGAVTYTEDAPPRGSLVLERIDQP